MYLLILFAAALVGIAIRYALDWAFNEQFTLKGQMKQIIVSFVVMIPFVALFYFLGFHHWGFWFLIAGGGFLTKFIVEKANKIKG